MRIVFVPHARERMEQRGITEDDVRACLEAPDITVPAQKTRTRYMRRSSDGTMLSVVAEVRKTFEPYFVVTTTYRGEKS